MNYTSLIAGMVAGYFLRPHLAKAMAKMMPAQNDMGALQMGAIDMNGLAMQRNPVHMGAIDMNGFGAVGMQQNPLHMGAIDMNGLSRY